MLMPMIIGLPLIEPELSIKSETIVFFQHFFNLYIEELLLLAIKAANLDPSKLPSS